MAFSTQAPATFAKSAIFPDPTSDGTTEFYMTAQFTPPPECETRMATTYLDGRSASAQWDYEFGNNGTLTCSDPQWVLAMRKYLTSTKTGLFLTDSVAGVCPSGYNIVGTAKDRFSNQYYDYNIDGGGLTTTTVAKSLAYCCPSGFTTACWTGLPRTFESSMDYFVAIAGQVPCQKVISTETSLLAVVNCFDRSEEDCTQSTSTVTASDLTVLDRGYKMEFDIVMTPFFSPASAYAKNTDISRFESEPNIPTCRSSSTGPPGRTGTGLIPQITSGDQPYSNNTASDSGLSRGAIGGIIGGVIGGLAIIGAFITWLVLHSRKTRRPVPEATAPATYYDGRHPHEMHGASAQVYETHGAGMTELPQPGMGNAHELVSEENKAKAAAMAGGMAVYELPGGMPVSTSPSPTAVKDA